MAKFITLNIGGKTTELPLADDSPEAISAAIAQAFPGEAARFPDSADALDDALVATTTTPTTTDPDGGALSLNRIAQALTASTARAADRTRAENPVANAARERVLDPLLRLNRPAGGDLEGLFGPEAGALSNASDVLQLGSAAAAPALAAIGAGGQALGQTLGQSPTGAAITGGVMELISGIGTVPFISRSAKKAGEVLLTDVPSRVARLQAARAARLPDDVTLDSIETMGEELASALSQTFSRRSARLGAEFSDIEKVAVKNAPTILPASDGYTKLQDIIDYTNDSVAVFGGEGGATLKRIADAVTEGHPVSTAEIVRLRKGLKDLATRGRSNDPDVASNAKKAVHVRNEADTVLESVMDPQTLERWRTTKAAWSSTVAGPKDVLHQVIDTKSPFEAFKAVFQNQDPEIFRTVLNVAKSTPSVAGKLKLGFLETIRDNTNTLQDAGRLNVILEQLKPMVHSSGLFNPEEMAALSVLVRRRAIPSITESLANVVSPTGGMRIGTGLAIAGSLTHDPTSLFLAAAAAGALPTMRRLAVLPPGSAAAHRAALEIGNQLTRFASAMMKDRTLPRESGATPSRPN